jgi:hypothetical protein
VAATREHAANTPANTPLSPGRARGPLVVAPEDQRDFAVAGTSFPRGHHPILPDDGIIDVVRPIDPSLGVPALEAFEPARLAMGATGRHAGRVAPVDMAARGELAPPRATGPAVLCLRRAGLGGA